MDKEKIKKLRIICKNIAVLYVEDDKSISQQLEKLLRKIFTNISVEKNGLLGLENFTKNRQEIVITDISMPTMDGLEMSKKIKLLNQEQNIIVTSAHNDMEYLLQLIDIGVDRFILKPIDFNAFFTSISKVAISIYREKKEIFLEDRLHKRKNLQVEILNSMIIPLIYFEEGVVNYVNNSFKECFFTKADEENLTKFRLGHFFEDKRFVLMDNDEIIHKIQNSKKCTYSVFNYKERVYKRYGITVSNFQNCSGSLVSFLNIDSLSTELRKLSNIDNYFASREDFKQRIAAIKSDTRSEEYTLFCIGLKNREFISTYGGREMHTIYKEFAQKLKKDLHVEIADGSVFLYFFETNRYIILTEKSFLVQVKKKLETFGSRNRYNFGSRLPFNIEITQQAVEADMPLEEILKKAEGMLYIFD